MLADDRTDRENRIRESLNLLRPLRANCVGEIGHSFEERRTKSTEDVLDFLERTFCPSSKTEDRTEDVCDSVAERLENIRRCHFDRLDKFAERLENGLKDNLQSVKNRSDCDVDNLVHPVSQSLESTNNPIKNLRKASEDVSPSKHLTEPVAEDRDNVSDLSGDQDHWFDEGAC